MYLVRTSPSSWKDPAEAGSVCSLEENKKLGNFNLQKLKLP